jgi:hypothetical protein
VSAPTAEGIRAAVERHVELWNAGEKEVWLAHWKSVVPGENTKEDPVARPLCGGGMSRVRFGTDRTPSGS